MAGDTVNASWLCVGARSASKYIFSPTATWSHCPVPSAASEAYVTKRSLIPSSEASTSNMSSLDPAFRLVHSKVKPETQIHTHMCYSEFTDIIPAIDAMDADVITFEASRSDLQILDSLKENNFKTEVGPGVYDIHSPRVPSVEEIVTALTKMRAKIEDNKLWVNPDCGLKTRGNEETVKSLKNLVAAAKQIRG